MALDAAIAALGGGPAMPNYAAMRQQVALSPAETAADAEDARSPANIAELRSQMDAYKGDPARLAPLQEEYAKVTGALNDSGPLSGAIAALSDTSAPVPAPKQISTTKAADEENLPLTGLDLASAASGPIGIGVAAYKASTRGSQPLAEAGKALASGIVGSAAGGLYGIYKLATTGGDTQAAADVVEATKAALTHQPQGEAAQAIVKGISSNWNPLNWPYAAGSAIADYGAENGYLSPAEAAAIKTGSMLVTPGMIIKGLGIGKAATEPAAFGSVGSAATTKGASTAADISGASPELQAVVKGSKAVNPEALARQVEADTLPVPIKLTKGQATQDPLQISFEQNNRGKMPELSQRFSEQSPLLNENLNAIRDKVAPDVYATNPVENAEAIIKDYQAKDIPIRADISAKYKALEDANGGNFPVDGVAFANDAYANLAKTLKTDFLPTPIANQLQKFKDGEPMSFEQFEAMRTNLAAEIRKAQRSGDGNAAYASGIVRDSLEQLPLPPQAAALKPLADAARSAAKARFDLLRKDPAYQAAVDDIPADKFFSKFVLNAPARDIGTMVQSLGAGSVGHQAMAAGLINHLKRQAGIIDEHGNFSAPGYNKAIDALAPKLLPIVGGEAANQLKAVGNVARNTTFQPRGSFVNNSNTLVGAMADHAKNIAEWGANKIGFGGLLPLGTMVRGAMAKRAANQAMMDALQTGAGIPLKDIGKK